MVFALAVLVSQQSNTATSSAVVCPRKPVTFITAGLLKSTAPAHLAKSVIPSEVTVTVNLYGVVESVALHKSSGHREADVEAVKLARMSTFAPETEGCHPVLGSGTFAVELRSNGGISVTGAKSDYPIPFNAESDVSGTHIGTPPVFGVGMGKTPVLNHKLVVAVQVSRQTLSPQSAAIAAYEFLFTYNVKRMPAGAVYIDVIVYEPPNALGAFPFSGYVFSRDSDNRWQSRPVSKNEITAIEEALGMVQLP
jgi:TonB family protein